jgi:hypothetical protein
MKSEVQKKWEERIQRAKKVREDWAKEFQTDLGRQYWEGKQNPGIPAEEWITVNKIYSHLQAQLPLLYSMDPYFYVKLKKSHAIDPQSIAQMEAKGKVRQAMLNYLKGELGLKPKARLGILDAHFEYGVLKVRRASEAQEHPQAGKPILDDNGNELKDEQTGKPLVYPDRLPVNERYELHRVHPCDYLWDEDAGPLEDSWKWCAQHMQMSKARALDDKRFNRSAVKSIKGKARSDSEKDRKKTGLMTRLASKFTKDDDDDLFVDVWEIYDIESREFLMIAEDADDPLIKPRSLPPGIEKHPFSILRFTLRDNSPYPIPPVSPAIDPQKEYSTARSRLQTHRKRFNRKYEVDTNKLAGDADAEISKIESGEDGTCIRVMALGAVTPIKDAPLDQQNLQELMLLNNDMVEIFGTPAAARGVADADSATEASILDKRLEVREGDRLSMVVDWVLDAARKLDQLVQFHIDGEEAVKITGPQGEFWQIVKDTDYQNIEGEFEYSVNLGASQPRLPQIERSQWIAFLSQVIVPFPHILTAPAIMKRMAEMFGIEDDAALEEFRQLGLKMMSGELPMPGGQGGGPSNNPVAAVLGAAMGPMGGNTNGGGAPTVQQ